MISGIVQAIKIFGLLKSLAITGAIFVGLGITYGVWHHKVYKSGVDDAVAGIARADAKLVDRATKARAKLKSCQAFNREWDQSTGNCK